LSKTVTIIEQPKIASRKRVAAYCRVSTDHEAQLESLENQMETFRYRAAQRGDWDLVNIYADEGLSGTTLKGRVQFQQMIKDCEAGKIDYIITKSISRFARNTVDTLQTVRELQKHGVQVFFEKEGIDTADALSEMILTIMASFAQEESRSISENVKWGIRKRFEAGNEVKVPLYGFYHSKDELFLIQEDEAAIVREIFERFVHGEAPMDILNDMTARGVKPPAGNKWKRLQLDRMIKNEKYAGDVVLQKTYIEDHLEHKQVRNKGELPMFRVENAHSSIVDRHIFEQAQKIMAMRNVAIGNSTYPYGEMLRCPHCGKPLVHGSLNNFYYDGVKIQNGGWGCYGEGGCGEYLIIQNRLDEAMITAYEDKYGEKKETVEFYWLDDTVEEIRLGEHQITIQWRDGETSVVEMDFSEERYCPSRYSDFYNDFLDRIRCGEKKNKYKYLMGLTPAAVQAG
jgi:site-specific DNA recombinase